jgi:hypothetical protein
MSLNPQTYLEFLKLLISRLMAQVVLLPMEMHPLQSQLAGMTLLLILRVVLLLNLINNLLEAEEVVDGEVIEAELLKVKAVVERVARVVVDEVLQQPAATTLPLLLLLPQLESAVFFEEAEEAAVVVESERTPLATFFLSTIANTI